MAFTLRLTTLMTSSKITKAVCKLASSTRVSTARPYVSRHRCTCWPPLPKPVSPKSLAASTWKLSNAGRKTPDTFSCLVRTLNVADLTDSCIWYPMLPPTAYVTSAREKAAICMTLPIFRLASSIRLVISAKMVVRFSEVFQCKIRL